MMGQDVRSNNRQVLRASGSPPSRANEHHADIIRLRAWPVTFKDLRRCSVLLLAIPYLLLAGCVSKGTAEAQARAAYLAGQQQAQQIARQTQLQGPTITVLGQVRNTLVRWSADLTLAKALIAADFFGNRDPVEIVIQRAGQELRYDPQKLLNGEDVQMEPNDVIVLKN